MCARPFNSGLSVVHFNGKRVAVRQSGTLYYLHTDHLGSTSVTSNASGTQVGSQTYYTYGAVRTSSGTLQTDYTFTGQRLDADAGLLYYGARYYDAALGRFISADTIIPNPYNPQDLNRYSYVRNNPLKYVDPSGHDIIIVGGAGWSGTDPYDDPSWWEEWIREYTGWTHDQFLEKFYDPWMKAKTDEEKMKIAQETGVAIFKWDAVPGAEQWGSLADAATYLQKQINDWGLRDVTILGHSKGGLVVAKLLEMYEQGSLAKGEVKNAIAIDPPHPAYAGPFGGSPSPNASKTGVNVISLPAAASCWANPPCSSNIRNDFEFPGVVNNHDLQTHLAPQVFRALWIYGDMHARRWKGEE
jgi:RHS repeat-associated protein